MYRVRRVITKTASANSTPVALGFACLGFALAGPAGWLLAGLAGGFGSDIKHAYEYKNAVKLDDIGPIVQEMARNGETIRKVKVRGTAMKIILEYG